MIIAAIKYNVNHLLSKEKVAFVLGAYQDVYEDKNKSFDIQRQVDSNHYCRFLQGNYVSMIAAVLFQGGYWKNIILLSI